MHSEAQNRASELDARRAFFKCCPNPSGSRFASDAAFCILRLASCIFNATDLAKSLGKTAQLMADANAAASTEDGGRHLGLDQVRSELARLAQKVSLLNTNADGVLEDWNDICLVVSVLNLLLPSTALLSPAKLSGLPISVLPVSLMTADHTYL